MPIEESLNKILKEMWRLDEKTASGVALEESEKEFYGQNLGRIKEYYRKNNAYWEPKDRL